MDIQRVRTLTTGIVHTEPAHIYADLTSLLGSGILTHNLADAVDCLAPALKAQLTDPRFWDGKLDTTHVGEVDLQPLNVQELAAFWTEFEILRLTNTQGEVS